MPQKHCVLSATANERPPASRVMAWAKSPPQVFHSVAAMNAVELADADAMFVLAPGEVEPRRSQREPQEKAPSYHPSS